MPDDAGAVSRYDQDFNAWALEQAEALRAVRQYATREGSPAAEIAEPVRALDWDNLRRRSRAWRGRRWTRQAPDLARPGRPALPAMNRFGDDGTPSIGRIETYAIEQKWIIPPPL